ncbi:MAG: CHAD domain-containing protein, partial [Anaerolineae bacterium]|nr:CHAD domain-containing protein [Anaerolineae bacterium]
MRSDWDSNAAAFAARTIYKHLQSLKSEMDGVRRAEDIEYIHRMRVASRRFRNALDIFAFYFEEKMVQACQKQARRVTSSPGSARDKDVQIDSVRKIIETVDDRQVLPGLKRLVLRLNQERTGFQKKLISALDNLQNGT